MKKMVLAAVLGMITGNVAADNVAYNQAKEAGLKKCLSSIEKITDFIIEDGDAGVHSYWLIKKPNESFFSAVIERNFGDGVMIMTNVLVAPLADGSCYVEYEKILNASDNCLALSQNMDGLKYKNQVNKEIALFDQGGTSVYLMPNGNQCTMVKKEIMLW